MSTNKLGSVSILLLGAVASWFALGQPFGLRNLADQALSGLSPCGTTYRVVSGDTLQKIAKRVYGTGDYQAIFEANRDTLTSAARLDIGDDILIPCRGATTQTTAKLRAARAGTRTAALERPGVVPREPVHSAAAIMSDPPPNNHRIRFLTGSDFAPFVHSDLPGNGMAAEIVRLAMASAAPRRDFAVTLDAGWSGHLDLLAKGDFDVGFPWYRPDCARAGRLSASMRRRCTGFDFSAPLFEVAIGYYVRQGDPLAGAAEYGALAGRRICRPANHFTFDLDQQGLGRSDATLVFPPAPDDCFALLGSGAVDVVTLSKPLAEKSLLQLGLVGRVAEIPALASVQTLHAIAAKANPYGRTYLDLIDTGAAELHRSGRWFEVAAHHLGAFGLPVR